MAHGQKIIERILELLQGQAEATATLIDVLTSDYAASYRKMRSGKTVHFRTDWASAYHETQRFYSVLNRLKREGLVGKKKAGRSSVWTITKSGLEKLRLLRRRSYPTRDGKGNAKDNGTMWKIIIFDIPEKERHKRAWLRAVLREMGFTMRQRSVWMGRKKIPQEFIDDLRLKRMTGYVDLFGVTKSGTLEDLLK